MSDFDYLYDDGPDPQLHDLTYSCVKGHRNPFIMCRCNSASIEPCGWHQWWEAHEDCEHEEDHEMA